MQAHHHSAVVIWGGRGGREGGEGREGRGGRGGRVGRGGRGGRGGGREGRKSSRNNDIENRGRMQWPTGDDVDVAVLVPVDGELGSIAGAGKVRLHILQSEN